MGEADYTLVAIFGSKNEAMNKFEVIKKFIKEGQKSYEYWQGNRSGDRNSFWETFKVKFPNIYSYLGELAGGDCDNELAGKLDFGYEEEPEIDGKVITFEACVWHFADWDLFKNYLEKVFDAKVTWKSDEYD